MGNRVQLKRQDTLDRFENPAPIGIDFDELNAYNAAFHELGLRWHWDATTYATLLHSSPDATTRIRHYVVSHHPHLLKAYDADFLVAAIESKKRQFEAAMTPSAGERGYFDWAQSRAGELGC